MPGPENSGEKRFSRSALHSVVPGHVFWSLRNRNFLVWRGLRVVGVYQGPFHQSRRWRGDVMSKYSSVSVWIAPVLVAGLTLSLNLKNPNLARAEEKMKIGLGWVPYGRDVGSSPPKTVAFTNAPASKRHWFVDLGEARTSRRWPPERWIFPPDLTPRLSSLAEAGAQR